MKVSPVIRLLNSNFFDFLVSKESLLMEQIPFITAYAHINITKKLKGKERKEQIF